MKIKIIYLYLLLVPGLCFSQDRIVDDYVRQALESNLALKQQEQDVRSAMYALDKARSFFMPRISLNARYTVADGGRMIDFPVGDMLNGVYSTLNTIAGTSFPALENMQFPFLRPTEQETKLRLTQPLLKTDIYYNRKIQSDLYESTLAGYESYKRRLVAEVKSAYFEYLKLSELVYILNNTRSILDENLRVNEGLLRNDKVTKDVVLRSQTEIQKLEEDVVAAENGRRLARAWFNFLLNRDFESEIIITSPELPDIPVSLQDVVNSSLSSREELRQIRSTGNAAENVLKMKTSDRLPELFAVVDYGFQGEKYSFTGDDDFMLASLVLQWDLFKGFENREERGEAGIALDKAGIRLEETSRLIELEVTSAWLKLVECSEKLQTSDKRALTENEVFRLVSGKYEQGAASLLEYINARNSMTTAEQQCIINKYDYLIAYTEFEKVSAKLDLLSLTESGQTNERIENIK